MYELYTCAGSALTCSSLQFDRGISTIADFLLYKRASGLLCLIAVNCSHSAVRHLTVLDARQSSATVERAES